MDRINDIGGSNTPTDYQGTEAERLAVEKGKFKNGDTWSQYDEATKKFTNYFSFSESVNDWIEI